MFSNSHSSDTTLNKQLGETMDFSRRAELSELMDQPCSYEDFRACLNDLAQVNSMTLARLPTMQWLQRFSQLRHGKHALHIMDVGSGGGDMLRCIERWALLERIPVRLTGIDLNPYAVQAAQEFTAADSSIRWIAGDVYSFDYVSEPIDLVISSLVTHHLDDPEIVRFLGWMEQVSKYGWFVSDLFRSRTSYNAFKMLARVAGWHRFIQNDGPISVRRAFRLAEWKRYTEAACLPMELIRIERHWPGRLTVSRTKQL
jgi:2-polyprenyl-3-methyl-5-hydroxy-6-metoxy-1,4-benzoquinol methylase